MRVNNFLYQTRQGIKSVKDHSLMSLASVGVLTACLLIVGIAILFTMNVDALVGYVEAQNQVVIFVEDAADDAAIAAVGEQLQSMPNLTDIRYVSKEAGFEEIKAQYGAVMEGLQDDNPLPARYDATVVDLTLLEQTVAELQSIEGVMQVNAPTGMASTLVNAKQLVNIFGFALIAALVAVSLVIIANTIRAAVAARSCEVGIMKYVGATDGFIRLPFIIEGVLLGLIAAVVAFGLVYLGYHFAVRELVTTDSALIAAAIRENAIPFRSVALRLGLSFLVGGVLTGVVGSLVSLRSHLKV